MTEDTIAAIAKAQTAGILESTGIYSYDLSDLISLIPVVTPWRDMVARVKSPDGNPYAVWRSILNLTNSQPDGSMGFDYAANEVQFSEQDFQARYKPTGYSGLVTQDAYDLAYGYADPYAVSTFNTLNQVLIMDDRKLMGGQSFALAAASAPTLTGHTTGGTIATSSCYIGVAARTGSGYYYGSGNSQGASTQITGLTGSTNSVTATTTSVKGAVAYDWFYGTTGSTWYYITTTTVNTLLVTTPITTNNALPSATACPDLSTQWKGSAGVPTYNSSADNGSANANDYDGLLANLAGDYNGSGQWVQSGTGTANPAINTSLDGAALTLTGGTITEIEADIFVPLWNAVKCSPTSIMVNAQQAQKIANLILGSTSATTYLQTDPSGRMNITGGGRIGSIINAPAGGVEVPIEVHVSLPPGTIVGRSDRVPFPQANISSVFEYRALRDTAQFDYGISRVAGVAGGGPRKEYEIRSVGAFLCRAPVAQAVIQNVAST
jgi:hypothetical protein